MDFKMNYISTIKYTVIKVILLYRIDATVCPFLFTPRTVVGQTGLSLPQTNRQYLQGQALVPEGVLDVLLEN